MLRPYAGHFLARFDALADDLIGIRLVLCSALLAGGLTAPEREELERSEREARELLREVVKARMN